MNTKHFYCLHLVAYLSEPSATPFATPFDIRKGIRISFPKVIRNVRAPRNVSAGFAKGSAKCFASVSFREWLYECLS